jgi:hypothetical protein
MKGRNHLGDRVKHEKKMKTLGVRVRIGINWLRVGSSVGLLSVEK